MQGESCQRYSAPIMMMSSRADIATAVEAVKHGAFDFIGKPFRSCYIVDRLKEAIADRLPQLQTTQELPVGTSGLEQLTRRQREILTQCMRGASSKETSQLLGISPRTVEDHRTNIMRKLRVRNVAQMVRMAKSAPPV